MEGRPLRSGACRAERERGCDDGVDVDIKLTTKEASEQASKQTGVAAFKVLSHKA